MKVTKDNLTQNLKVVIEELKIIQNRYKEDLDLFRRARNSIDLLEKWF